MTEQLIDHTEKQKKKLANTIGSRLWLGFEELSNTMGFGTKKKENNENEDKKSVNKYQITAKQEKEEKKLIEKRKIAA